MMYRARIFYLPGLISLSLLLALCIGLMEQRGIFKKEAIIPVRTWRAKELSRTALSPSLPKRSFSRIFLIGEKAETALGNCKSAIQQINSQGDTIGGVLLQLTAGMKYQSLISVLDILRAEKLNWLFVEDKIWVWHEPPSVPNTSQIPSYDLCGTAEVASRQVEIRMQKEQATQTSREINKLASALWASWILFLGLVIAIGRKQAS